MFDEPEIRPEVEAWLRERAAPPPAAAERYELLDGERVALTTHTEEGVACLERLIGLLTAAAGDDAVVSVRSPVALSDESHPCPDIALLRPGDDGPVRSLPSPDDTLLMVEVADSTFSLTHNRGRKAALYARAGVPECWVIDLLSGQLLLHRSPASGGYRDIRHLRGASVVGLGGLPGVSIDLGRLLDEG